MGETAPIRDRVDTIIAQLPGHSEEFAAEVQILGDAHLLVQRSRLGQVTDFLSSSARVGHDVDAVDRASARGGRQVAGDHADRSGFACSVGTEEADDLTSGDLKAQIIDRENGSVPLGEMLGDDHCLGQSHARTSLLLSANHCVGSIIQKTHGFGIGDYVMCSRIMAIKTSPYLSSLVCPTPEIVRKAWSFVGSLAAICLSDLSPKTT